MGNVVYDLANNGLRTDYVVKSILNKLYENYNREFEVLKIGERYGIGNTNEVTALCSVKSSSDFVFRVKYDMIEEKIIEENFKIRCTCFFVEKEINKLLINANSIARVEISRKSKLDNVYRIEDFLNKFPNEKFVSTIIVEKNKINDFTKFLLQLNDKYKNLKINALIYEMKKEDFNKFYESSKNIDEFTISYVESFKFDNKQRLKLENGNIKIY